VAELEGVLDRLPRSQTLLHMVGDAGSTDPIPFSGASQHLGKFQGSLHLLIKGRDVVENANRQQATTTQPSAREIRPATLPE
jgi:hypothetical protein